MRNLIGGFGLMGLAALVAIAAARTQRPDYHLGFARAAGYALLGLAIVISLWSEWLAGAIGVTAAIVWLGALVAGIRSMGRRRAAS